MLDMSKFNYYVWIIIIFIRNICDFVNEDFDANMLDIKVVNSFFDGVESQTCFSKIPIYRWRKRLTENQLIFIDLITKEYRRKLNYPDSDVKLSFLNLIPFIFYVIKKLIESSRNEFFFNGLLIKSSYLIR